MKSALNWCHSINSENATPAIVIEEAGWNAVTEEQVKQIQLDAMREGMRRAAELCEKHKDLHPMHIWTKLHEAAEQLTIENL